jgi:type II secretion system protein N
MSQLPRFLKKKNAIKASLASISPAIRDNFEHLSKAFEKQPPLPKRESFFMRPSALVLWGTITFFVFLAKGFPSDDLANFLLTLPPPEIQMRAESAIYHPPLGVSYRDMTITAPTNDGPISLDFDRARGNIDLVTLVSGKPRYNFDVKMYGGEFKGRLRRFYRGKVSHLKGTTIHPIDLSTTRKLTHQDLSGLMDLQTDYTWKTGMEDKGHGILSLSIAKLVVRSLNMNGFPLPPISFTHVHGMIRMKNGLGHIETLNADGPMAHLTGKGDIALANPYPRSIVNLDFDISLRGELAKIPLPSITGKNGAAIHLHLSGALGSPQVSLNGIVLPR